jgi:hypothetical protein
MNIKNLIAVTGVCVVAGLSTGCTSSMTPAQVAQEVLVVTGITVQIAQSVWVDVYPLIPAAQQAQAQRDFSLAILSVQTAEATLQDAVTIGSTTNYATQIAALEDAISKLIALVDAFNTPAVQAANTSLTAHVQLLHKVAGQEVAAAKTLKR